MIDAISHAESDRLYLRTLIRRDLNPEQWAALLSFSYNLGRGNADNLVNNINSGNNAALGDQWNQYVNAGGVPQDYLIARRAAEWQLFNS
jgi:lysozyme